MNCLNCGKELINTPGKREKKYCNTTCRTSHFQKRKNLLKNAVPLPADYVNVKNIGIVKPNGEIKVIEPRWKLKNPVLKPPEGLTPLQRQIWVKEHQ